MESKRDGSRWLGIDLGSNSIGWALLDTRKDDAAEMIDAGVRTFPAGVEGDIDSGQDASRNVERREARQRRRMTMRRSRRKAKIARTLQRAGLLPDGDVTDPVRRDTLLKELDQSIYTKYDRVLDDDSPERAALEQLPYFLRARALDHKLAPHELGRAFYHLSQRRGYLSNRKAPPKKDEKEGEVKKGIAELSRKIENAEARTLGEYYSKVRPEKADTKRIRDRWTARAMYQREFDRIWEAQAPQHPNRLTDGFRHKLHKAIFYQRPLKSQRHLIGPCSLEHGRRRARWALHHCQQFRMLQRVNDLEVTDPEGVKRSLSPDERIRLLDALDTDGDLTFGAIRKLLGLRGHTFNLEGGGEKKLPGNRTAARIIEAIGEARWDGLTSEDRSALVQDLISMRSRDALARRAQGAYGLDEETANELADVRLEMTFCRHSTKAIKKLLPLMEGGVPYRTAVEEIYGEQGPFAEPVDALPPICEVDPTLRNPAVLRTLTELRKVINALVRRHGKPDLIRVELARDLRKSRSDREDASKRNRRNQKAREDAKQKIIDEIGSDPSGRDIEKVLLAEECNWTCPYTGRTISMRALVGQTPQFDVEHIIPFHRCFNNSFFNKTLCYHEENRSRKKGSTPYEAYAGSPDNYAAILERVKKFQGSAAREKLRLFRMEDLEPLDDFASRQLNDTRYASRAAVEYLGLLYGGAIDRAGKRRVQATRGAVTRYLRDEWGLNAILGDGGSKSRDDHRHHAVDAVCIALTRPGVIKRLSDAAKRAAQAGRRRFAPIEPPWPGFLDDVRSAIETINVSHRPDRKVSGALHAETNYSPPIVETDENGNTVEYHRVRKPLGALSRKAIENQIVDDAVREAVLAKLDELGGSSKKVFQDPQNHPQLIAGDGRRIPIHKVRIRVPEKAVPVGSGHRRRHVLTRANHHVEIFETTDRKGRAKWDGEVVTMLEAHRRVGAGEPVVRRDHGPGTRFLFSLCGGDMVEIDHKAEGRALYVVRTIAKEGEKESIRFLLAPASDARRKTDMTKAGVLVRPGLESLRKLNPQKVSVDPLGMVRRAND